MNRKCPPSEVGDDRDNTMTKRRMVILVEILSGPPYDFWLDEPVLVYGKNGHKLQLVGLF